MTLDVHSARSGQSAEERSEQAQRAVRVFRTLQPTLTSYARVMTGRMDVQIVLSNDNGSTDGTRILYRPPIELGDNTPHVRVDCTRRDELGLMRCTACRIREKIIVTILHEIGHICFESFAPTDERDKVLAIKIATDEVSSEWGKRIAEQIKNAPHYKTVDFVNLASLINPYLPVLLNSLEDARVNLGMFKSRPGLRGMFAADERVIFEEGFAGKDGLTVHWNQAPLDSQALVACFVKAVGYTQYKEWFHPKVVEMLDDPEMTRLLEQVQDAGAARDIYNLSFKVLARLRTLGFCATKEDPNPPPPPEPEPEPQPESPEPQEESEPNEGGSSSDGQSNQSGESGESGEPGDESSGQGGTPDSNSVPESTEGERDLGGGGDEGDSSDDASDEGGEAESGESSNDASDSTEEGESSANQDGSDLESTGENSDADSNSESRGSNGDSDTDSTGSSSSNEYDIHSDSGSEGSPNESNGAGEFVPGTESDSNSTQSETSESQELDQPEGPNESEGEGLPQDDTDTGADDGYGGTRVDQVPTPESGNPEQASEILEKWLGHEKPKSASIAHAEEQAMSVAVMQGLYFTTPSVNIGGVREFYADKWDRDAKGWTDRKMAPVPIEIAESIIQPSLMRLRRTLTDNQRGAKETNLKSGKVNVRALGRRAWNNDERLFQKLSLPGRKDYAVIIGMDVSGSTRGINLQLEKRAIWAQATLLDRAGIPFAIYAHTGSTDMTTSKSVVDVYNIKNLKESWTPKVQERLLKIGQSGGNIDGHALEFLRKRADESRATDKIIMYYSDGKMPLTNYAEELVILQREIAYCKKAGYTLLGVGIRTDSPTAHGLDTVQVDEDEDLVKVVKHLGKRLSGTVNR